MHIIEKIPLVILCIGIISLIAGVYLLLLYLGLTIISAKGFGKDRIEKVFRLAYNVLHVGMLIFLLGLAGMTVCMAIEGLRKGEYKLRFSRIGGGYTRINWTDRPIRFAFQTVAYIGFSSWLIYFLVKQIRSFSRKKG
ncbi:hypothetical protein [Sphingobacterium athyrii]|uniref:Uncharacterized protein n=1 Tax=Sphingobacterium athyrii TaxID=2152717 RepID=A0A363NX32_9SPHI|nr:hypothetical protein [Sphingobacterium athyrii]PUV25268.1 hypothetical protein DCO56_10085 [Sphingobacterium athyrii]